MAWPWLFQANHELGTNAEYDTEVDTGSKLDFPHYSKLASQYTWSAAVPWKGAYCMRVEQSGTNAAFVAITQAIAVATSSWARFQFCVGEGWTATAGTTSTITFFRWLTAGTTSIGMSVGFRFGRIDATSLELGVGVSLPSTFATPTNFQTNFWHSVEVNALVNTTSSTADGSVYVYLDGVLAASATSTAMASVFQQVRLGILSGAAAGSIPAGLSGTFLFDDFIMDNTRLGPALNRFSETKMMTKSGHVFVGSGRLDDLMLIAQAVTTSEVNLYDTDQAGIIPQDKLKARLTAITSGDTTNLAGAPIYF